jgi:DNA invertase Pin-like site-specific DNA recombinase
MWNIVTSILSSVYEMERERILEVTEMGRKNYVMKGGKLGRKVGSTEDTVVWLNKPSNQIHYETSQNGKIQ